MRVLQYANYVMPCTAVQFGCHRVVCVQVHTSSHVCFFFVQLTIYVSPYCPFKIEHLYIQQIISWMLWRGHDHRTEHILLRRSPAKEIFFANKSFCMNHWHHQFICIKTELCSVVQPPLSGWCCLLCHWQCHWQCHWLCHWLCRWRPCHSESPSQGLVIQQGDT